MKRFWQKLPKPLAKFLGFMLIWTILANLYIVLNPPKHRPISKLFSICILQDNQPQRIYLNDFKGQPLCQTPFSNVNNGNAGYYFDMQKIAQITPTLTEWEMISIEDSPADPFVYRYQIDSSVRPAKPIALWETRDGWAVIMMGWTFALFATTIIHAILNRIIQRRNKQKTIN